MRVVVADHRGCGGALTEVDGLGVRPVGTESAADLHTPGFNPAEEAIALGTTILTATALLD